VKLVRIDTYDPNWPRRYSEEAPRVGEALGALVKAIEHIGSTSIEGLDAKPTIDILVGATSVADVDAAAKARMSELAYEFRDAMGVQGRCYFRKGSSFPREFNVHVVEVGGRLWRQNLAFRNYLRENPAAALEYGKLKRSLVSKRGGADLERYAAGKADFIAEILRRATIPES
jgi:GrpB-like predicted nucleotidyltransferase (UPF0157 family)